MVRDTNHTRRRALQAVGSAVVVGLAGCSSSEPSNPAEDATETPTASATATATDGADDGHDHDHDHRETEADDSSQFAENPQEVHATLTEQTSVSSDEVMIGFRLEDRTLPFETEVYHAPPDAEYQATQTYDTQDLAEVDLVPDPPEALETVGTDREDVHYATTTVGEPLPVTLVARHDEETLEWSSWNRTGHPYDGDEEEPGIGVDCYCSGEIYTAPSGGTWARVIQVTPTERVESGSTIVVNWTSSRA